MRNVLLVLFLGCLSSIYSQEIDSLKIGSGGGITGIVNLYKYENGKIYKGKGIVNFNYFESAFVKGKKKKKLQKACKSILKTGTDQNKPGNTYQFIEIYSKGKTLKLVWTNNDLPTNILQNIETLKEIIKTLQFSPNK